MKRDLRDTIGPFGAALLLIALGLLAVALWARCTTARAEPDRLEHRLAQLYVGEGVEDSELDQHALFWAIHNRAEARGVNPLQHLREYAWPLVRPHRDRSRWVAGLRLHGAEGEDWAEARVPWDSMADRWKAAIDASRADLAEPPPNPCRAPVEHWGSPRIGGDRHRAARAVHERRWRPLRCGPTRLDFFAVRRRGGG